MAKYAVRIAVFLFASHELIEPLKYQLAAPGVFFTVHSGEPESSTKDEMSLQQRFFVCGMNSECSNVATSTSDAKSETSEGKVQGESSSSRKGASWKKIQEQTLISRGKNTSQSTTEWWGFSSNAVDGNRNSDSNAKSCTHTKSFLTVPAWWRVDLGQRAMIYNVMITNRGDCCPERLRDFSIRIGFEDKNGTNPACRERVGITTSITVDFKCNDAMPGQFVYIESALPTDALTLCEVEVYGYHF